MATVVRRRHPPGRSPGTRARIAEAGERVAAPEPTRGPSYRDAPDQLLRVAHQAEALARAEFWKEATALTRELREVVKLLIAEYKEEKRS